MNLKDLFRKKPTPQDPQEEYRGWFNNNALNFNTCSSYTGNSRALQLSTVYRCTEVISDSVAQLPIQLVKKGHPGFYDKVYDHPIARILEIPNGQMSMFTLLKMMVSNMLLNGNGFCHIDRDELGNPIALKYVPSTSVSICPDTKQVGKYYYNVTGIAQHIDPSNMIHILGPSSDGIQGVSVLSQARKTLELSTDSENHAAGFLKSGANLSGILTVQGGMVNGQREKIKNAWQNSFQTGANGVAVLEGNMSFMPVTVNPADAQLLETRAFNVVEICRFFGVSPIKAFDLSAANYSTVEATQLAFLTDTLSPLLSKIEAEFNRKFFPQGEFEIMFDETELLRIDRASQAAFITQMINAGVMTPSEGRQMLGLPYREEADELFLQVNMSTLNKIKATETEKNGTEN